MRIVVLGIEGQLGGHLTDHLAGHSVVAPLRADYDLSQPDTDALAKAITGADWIIIAAAMTHVDACESRAGDAFSINAVGAYETAREASHAGVRSLLVSTDYVFDGRSGTDYVESDRPAPINVYGASKLAGEHLVSVADPAAVIVRTSGLYGRPGPDTARPNFVETMLRLGRERDELSVVDDEFLSPTYADDLASQIRVLIEAAPPAGVYHATSAGHCSWFEFAGAIFERCSMDVNVKRISAAEWKAPARRPARSVLDNAALRAADIDRMPGWKDALARYLADQKR